LRCCNFLASVVLQLQHKITKKPHELGHESMDLVSISGSSALSSSFNVLGKGGDHLELGQGHLVNSANAVVDEVGR
jgi:hypothetical protein